MSEYERRPQEPQGEKLSLELPRIKEGVAKEIFRESVIDKQGFMIRTANVMQRENPYLLEYIVDAAITAPSSEDVVLWPFRYYEIYARSAREEGIPMVRVEKDILEARESGIQKWNDTFDDQDNMHVLIDLVKSKSKEEDQQIEEDSKEYELAIYWAAFGEYQQNIYSEDEPDEYPEEAEEMEQVGQASCEKDTVFILRSLLHHQIFANKLAQM
jgi:hypothetical protein